MSERPILFSAPMVRAIRDDSKTQTRRIVKVPDWFLQEYARYGAHEIVAELRCPYGQPGDVKSTRFRDAAPPANGWYWVRWTDADQERLVWLVRVPDEPQDTPPDTEAHRWVWGKSPEDDPESIVLDIADPMSIEWRRPGDMLWVRETWAWPGEEQPIYRADQWAADLVEKWKTDQNYPQVKWTPSIHMPRWASRITLEVLGVRVERLQDISEADILAEGVRVSVNEAGRPCIRVTGKHPPVYFLRDWETATLTDILRAEWVSLWCETYGRDSWDANPWVWVVEFRRLP